MPRGKKTATQPKKPATRKKKQTVMTGDGFDYDRDDKAVKVGEQIVDCNVRIKEAMEERGELEKELAEILKSQGREHFRVIDMDTEEEYALSLNRVVKDKISVRKCTKSSRLTEENEDGEDVI